MRITVELKNGKIDKVCHNAAELLEVDVYVVKLPVDGHLTGDFDTPVSMTLTSAMYAPERVAKISQINEATLEASN